MSADRSQRIAELNDQLRACVGLPIFGCDVPGKIVMSTGIAELETEPMIKTWFAVNHFDQFTEDNDPYGEHDFGCIQVEGAGKVFWKIDYYENTQCLYGSEHPEDPTKSYRVLAIMLAEEY